MGISVSGSTLVDKGAVVLGPPPEYSPSLQNYPNADNEVKKMAAELWGKIDGQKVKYEKYGDGIVIDGTNLKEALDLLKIKPDFAIQNNVPVLYIHRTTPDAEIYFITNQGDSKININPTFRVKNMQPELWDPITGNIRTLPAYTENVNGISVPIKMEPSQSWFVIFKKSEGSPVSDNITDNFPEAKEILKLNGPWNVKFDSGMRGPKGAVVFKNLEDWTKSNDKSIKYYSGSAVYSYDFNLKSMPKADKILLDLGSVGVIAHVTLNGKDVGGVWTIPWSIDINKELKAGENKLEITVTNTWVNRIIGDLRLPKSERKTWLTFNPYKPNSPLEESGLLGPVRISEVNYKK